MNKNELEIDALIELMTFYPTLEETACWFNCSADTIERKIKFETDKTFKEFRQQYSGKTRLLLKRKAIAKALEEDNEKLLLYCLRAMTDLSDKVISNEKSDEVKTIRLAYSLD